VTDSARSIDPIVLRGRYVALSPLIPADHAAPLYAICHGPAREHLWCFLRDGPFPDLSAYRLHLDEFVRRDTFMAFAILDNVSGDVVGKVSLIRFSPVHLSIEIGYILFAPGLQGTRGGTEALYLVARHAFEHLGCRRCEWRSDSRNEASIRAATRLGFREEGILRQHMIVKMRNRDTVVFSLLDGEWPARKAAIELWLRPANFDASRRQITALRR